MHQNYTCRTNFSMDPQ